MDQTKYWYEVRPQRLPRIPGRRPSMTRQSLLLTKDEVKQYMKYGVVYRKSASGKLMKVTGETLNDLHKDIDTIEQNQAVKKETPAVPAVSIPPRDTQGNGGYNAKYDKKNKHHNYQNDRGNSSVNNTIPSINYQQEDTPADGNDTDGITTGNSIEVNL